MQLYMLATCLCTQLQRQHLRPLVESDVVQGVESNMTKNLLSRTIW